MYIFTYEIYLSIYLNLSVYLSIYIKIHTHTHTHAHTDAHTHAHTHTHIHVAEDPNPERTRQYRVAVSKDVHVRFVTEEDWGGTEPVAEGKAKEEGKAKKGGREVHPDPVTGGVFGRL